MAEKWRIKLYADAKAAVDHFVSERAGFSLADEDPDDFEARIDLAALLPNL